MHSTFSSSRTCNVNSFRGYKLVFSGTWDFAIWYENAQRHISGESTRRPFRLENFLELYLPAAQVRAVPYEVHYTARYLSDVCFTVAGELRRAEQTGVSQESQEESLEGVAPETDFCADR